MHQSNSSSQNISPGDNEIYKLQKNQEKSAQNEIILTPLQQKNSQKRQSLKKQLKARIESLCPQKKKKLIKKCHLTDSPEIYQYLHEYQLQVSKKGLTFYNVWLPLNIDDFTSIYWKNVEVPKLTGCEINDIGWVKILRYSYMFPHVKVIHLEKNLITDIRLKFILKTLPSLKLLFIGYITKKLNYLTKSCIQQLVEYQKTKQTNALRIQYTYYPRYIARAEQNNSLKRQQRINNELQITVKKQEIQQTESLTIQQKQKIKQSTKNQLQINNQSSKTLIPKTQCSFKKKYTTPIQYCQINQNNQDNTKSNILQSIEQQKQQRTFETMKHIQSFQRMENFGKQQQNSIKINSNDKQSQKILFNLQQKQNQSQKQTQTNQSVKKQIIN